MTSVDLEQEGSVTKLSEDVFTVPIFMLDAWSKSQTFWPVTRLHDFNGLDSMPVGPGINGQMCCSVMKCAYAFVVSMGDSMCGVAQEKLMLSVVCSL